MKTMRRVSFTTALREVRNLTNQSVGVHASLIMSNVTCVPFPSTFEYNALTRAGIRVSLNWAAPFVVFVTLISHISVPKSAIRRLIALRRSGEMKRRNLRASIPCVRVSFIYFRICTKHHVDGGWHSGIFPPIPAHPRPSPPSHTSRISKSKSNFKFKLKLRALI